MGKTAHKSVDKQLKPRTEAQIRSLQARVQLLLDKSVRAKSLGYRLRVSGYQQVENWLNFVVVPVGKGVRAYEYAQTLTDVDQEIGQAGEPNVLLVPALAD